jgi:hypothetical protein
LNAIMRFPIPMVALCLCSAVAGAPASAADGRTGAFVGGAALGAVGGVLLGQALANRPPPPPVVVQPAPVVYDPYFSQLDRLHADCDDGSRRACIAFGEFIGEHREREAQWRRMHPDLFRWDD